MNLILPKHVIALTILFVFGCSFTLVAQRAFRHRTDSLLSAHSSFSGIVLVADQGKTIYQSDQGFRDYARRTALKKGDVFELASISKTFTAMAIILLAQEGKLAYDDSLSKYLSVPYPGITIRHLLTHTSGLPDYQAVMDAHWDKSRVAGNPEILEYLNRYAPPARFAPGERYEYSNTGYVLLGSIVEKASGIDFVRFCEERIFDKLGMKRTAIRSNEEKARLKAFALGHIWSGDKQRYIRADSFPASDYTLWLGNRKGPGRVSSNARDLLRWDQALYGEHLLPQAAIREAFQPAKLNDGSSSNYGFGWMLEGLPVLGITTWHSGDNPGYHTRLMRYTGKRLTLIILNNNAYPKIDELVKGMETLLADRYAR